MLTNKFLPTKNAINYYYLIIRLIFYTKILTVFAVLLKVNITGKYIGKDPYITNLRKPLYNHITSNNLKNSRR